MRAWLRRHWNWVAALPLAAGLLWLKLSGRDHLARLLGAAFFATMAVVALAGVYYAMRFRPYPRMRRESIRLALGGAALAAACTAAAWILMRAG